MERVELKSLLSKISGKILWNESLSKHTSLKVGGQTAAFIYPKDIEELKCLYKIISQNKIPYFILGDGSNFLPTDESFSGITLNLSKLNKIEIVQKDQSDITVYVEAGVSKQKLLYWAVDHGYSGLEFLIGVPGQVGGGLFMNAGTHRGSFSDVVHKIGLLNKKGEIEDQMVTHRDFSYRSQSFCKGKIIVSAVLNLIHGDQKKMREEVKWMVSDRKAKQPLRQPNCGSIFKNPEGQSAGKLIEASGLKGFQIGEAMVSKKHANFIVNLGGAKAQDIKKIIEHIKKIVYEKQRVQLEEEVVQMSFS